MTDTVDSKTRSRMMAGIGGKDTKPEMLVRRALHRRGFRFRLHAKDLPGRPDLVFPKYRAVVFVHGCFWHRHEGCRFATVPSTRADFWKKKFEANVARDQKVIAGIRAKGWRTAVVWECTTKGRGRSELVVDALAEWLTGESSFIEIGSPDSVENFPGI
ncbi:DNA mismatch endonuclease Vsr [Qipengyuania sp. 1XM1-15A]|nr:DNA mismatch endonuclease Vsr [Qipengyuania xiamenensis]MBX7532631.1 DNA mismatch endonuclease Vsr [Qipengyuania xiamenensis]